MIRSDRIYSFYKQVLYLIRILNNAIDLQETTHKNLNNADEVETKKLTFRLVCLKNQKVRFQSHKEFKANLHRMV